MARNLRVTNEDVRKPDTDSEEEEVEENTESETDSEEDITELMETFTKQQLIGFIRSILTENTKIIEEIQPQPDQNPSHHRIFVHGLGLETTSDNVREIFSSYGEIEDCNVVVDKNTTGRSGRCCGFILYKHRKSVAKALKEPIKRIGSRLTACNLASSGPIHVWKTRNSSREVLQRKIFVGNINDSHFEITGEKLHSFFSKYGEIEAGPLGYDLNTGRFKGYALFIYKTVQGARKALEKPIKNFNGHPLYCEMATDYQVNTSCQIGPSGHGPAKPLALARTRVCLDCVGYYLDKLVLFILFFVGIVFLLLRVDRVFAIRCLYSVLTLFLALEFGTWLLLISVVLKNWGLETWEIGGYEHVQTYFSSDNFTPVFGFILYLDFFVFKFFLLQCSFLCL